MREKGKTVTVAVVFAVTNQHECEQKSLLRRDETVALDCKVPFSEQESSHCTSCPLSLQRLRGSTKHSLRKALQDSHVLPKLRTSQRNAPKLFTSAPKPP